ncbi:glucosamine-6-phosphate deaminase [Kocuria sp.]|uniref:glucosamine-6-phosphate deaminase n=1 Tax=Kocuria sp. TaxID=1871328 RepID=UPI0026DAED83|nr:glucosamine-6-phosphate deaminase [Kocuria sp.]MDO4919062.1 glucosamine-6-phosphate deaminase [Kocuria sp.]
MHIIVCDTLDEVATTAADVLERAVRQGPTVLGLATGGTPQDTYRELIRRHHEEGLSFSAATAFTLDEYVGLAPEHEQSYRATILRDFVSHVDLPVERLHTPRGDAPDPTAEAHRYEESLARAGWVDVQLLGIGTNGHIGFNEPTSSLASRTTVRALTRQTRADNARFFTDEEVPHLCLTQGLGTIREARELLLLAEGRGKARAVRDMAEGSVSARCPASVLQLHPRATVVLDREAAGELEYLDYYREAARLLRGHR